MNRKRLGLILALFGVALPLFAPAAMADQDVIIVDPEPGVWQEFAGLPIPGDAATYRDDLFEVPANTERIICFMDGETPTAAAKLRYSIRRGPEWFDLVEVIDKSGSGTGVTIRWNGYKAVKTCDHTDPDDCEFSGIAPELFGDFVGDAVEARVGGDWVVVTGPIQIQTTVTASPSCTAF